MKIVKSCLAFVLIVVFANCQSKVSNSNILAVKFEENNLTIKVGQEKLLFPTLLTNMNPNDCILTWSSSDSSKVTVDNNGKVKGIASTTTPVIITLTVSGGGKTAESTCLINVVSIETDPPMITVDIDKTEVHGLPSDFIGTWKTDGEGFFKDWTYIITSDTMELIILDVIDDLPYFPCHYIDSINYWQALDEGYWSRFNENYPGGYYIRYTMVEKLGGGTGEVGMEGWHWLLLSNDKNTIAYYSNAPYVPEGSYYSIYYKE